MEPSSKVQNARQSGRVLIISRRLSHDLSFSQAADLRTIHSFASAMLLKPPRFSCFPEGRVARTHHSRLGFVSTGSNSTVGLTSIMNIIWRRDHIFASP